MRQKEARSGTGWGGTLVRMCLARPKANIVDTAMIGALAEALGFFAEQQT